MIRISVLNSGIRLVTEAMPDVASASIGVWVGTGSRDETAAQAGISHFLEHLLFKGTQARTARDIAEAVDAVGGDMNAYTTKEYTTFYVRALSEHLQLGLDILCDILREPALRGDDVDAERQVILEEVLMHRDEPADVVQERFGEAMFPLHPLGREVLGDPEVIERVTVPEIRAFFDQHYLPGNMVVAAAGDVVHDVVADEIERRFVGRDGGGAPARTPPGSHVEPLQVEARDTEQVQLVVGTRGPARRSPERFSLAALNHALGGGLSSRLFQEVRETRGLAYSIGSDRLAYEDAGALSVSVGTAPEHAAEVLELIGKELEQLRDDGMSARELEVAKGHLRADLLLSLEDSGARMSRIGASLLLHDEVLTVDDLLGRIAAVTLADVAGAAERVLSGPRALAVVGPFDEADFRSFTSVDAFDS
ncbi:MAG TPA: pitrilysin family protein [Acidimicrobiales bacterium]|nr:pitrilysin family protein [Acidimicrobiales bacterium]